TATEGGAVARKVLGSGKDVAGTSHKRTLEAAHLGRRHRSPQVGVLTGAFNNAPPAGITRDVDHGCESPVDSNCPCLRGRHTPDLLDPGRIPRGSHSQGNRENSVKSVDHVISE